MRRLECVMYQGGEAGAVGEVEFSVYLFQVFVHGPGADPEGAGDLPVGGAGGHVCGDLPLPGGQFRQLGG